MEDPFGDTTQETTTEPGQTLSPDDDQVCVPLVSVLADSDSGLSVQQSRGNSLTELRRELLDFREGNLSTFAQLRFLGRRRGESEWLLLDDREHIDGRIEALSESEPTSCCPLRFVAPIYRDYDTLVHLAWDLSGYVFYRLPE